MPTSYTQRIGNCPTALQSQADAVVCKAGFSGPRGDALGATIMRQIACAATVFGLLSGGCPATVFGFIVPTVVDAVDRVSIGALTHVGDEVDEVVPSGTDDDAAPPVVCPLPMLGSATSVAHRMPSPVSFRAGHAVRSLISTSQHVAVEAAAASGIPLDDCVHTFGDDSATVASELPHGGAPLVFGSSDSGEASKLSPCMIVHFCHAGPYHTTGVV